MSTTRRSLSTTLAAAMAATSAVPAFAHGAVVSVQIHDEGAGMPHRLVTTEGVTIASCVGDCTMQVPLGRYTLRSSETESLRSGDHDLVVRGPTRIDVSPGAKSTRRAGWIAMIVGSTAFLVGVVGFATTFDLCVDGDRCSKGGSSSVPWLITMGAGTAVTLVGWVAFLNGGTNARATPASTVSLGAAPRSGGGFFTAAFTF